ncbi:hypothetical protein U9M48_036855 [Paspalum notatum var. saurae]|uniref:SWIM-type domain-containing protein n=1 Tax=Paspalum notatum var. saurae TaxID=547442 RepID=A0AAQ3UK02_PASNO
MWWLERGFQIDTETHVLTVQTLVTWANEGVENYGNTSVAMAEDVGFEYGQQNEDGHINLGVAVVGHGASGTANDEEGNGRQHEVEEQAYEGPEPQGHEEDGHGSQAEPQGLADEGERIPSIVQQMQNEDDEFAQAQEIGEGSDEDEDYPIPGEWREHGFGNPVVHDAKQQEWEYRENEVVQGAKYASSALLKKAVKLWSLSLKKEFKVVKSTQSVYDVCCVSEGCPWRLHTYKGIMKTHWKVSIITEHTCYNREVPKYNRNLTAALVANEIYGRILDAPYFEPKQIIREMELQHQYTISYAKAYRAKQKVFEMRFGTYEDSYDNLPRMLATIAQRNPGTYYDVMHFPNPEGGPSILQRVFFCLGPCVRAFQYCLPLLCIDGTFLTGKYKGTVLTAIGVHGNNQVLPVAFAFVENENADSWYWFLERVKTNADLSNASVLFGRTITKYMETKTDKAQIHNARLLGTRENRFEVSCRDRSRRGVRRERTVQETVIGNDGTAYCSCMKPTLLHLPCSHVLAACRDLSVDPTNFVSTFYTKGAIAATWNQELFGYGMVRAYTAPNEREMRLKGRRRTRRIRNGMDEAEAGKRPKRALNVVLVGHNYKKCPENAFPAAAEAGPSGNATDGAPPNFELASESRARSRRSVFTRSDVWPRSRRRSSRFDPVVDSGHRSYISAVEHKHLATFQSRPPKEYLELDNRWLQRLRGAGLLTFCRLVEGGPIGRHGRGRPRLMIDNSLITAQVDRWRPETHTFHMPCGEMAPTLQDVSYLLGLPIAGTAVGPRVVAASWKDNLEIRFAGVDRLDDLGALEPHPNARGPAKAWLLQFKATGLHPDTYDESVCRSLEAYLLWPFGFIMFKNGTSNSVDKLGFELCRAATYRGLCDARSKDESNARFRGCALLLRLWSYERLAVGRPIVDHRGYEAQYYGQHDDDGSTMGTLWVCSRERTWANEQARRTYPSFVVALDRLVAEDVIWEPYSAAAVGSRAPYELSSLCTSNETLWYTTASLVYDIYIEPHCPHRAMRQFGYAQQFPVPRVIDRVTPQDHTLSRLGQPCSGTWVTKVEPYVQAWDNAHQDMVHPVAPHTDWWYETFLTWYRPRTRCHVTYADTQPVPHESSSTDAYARHRDEALAGAVSQCFNSC